MAFSTKNENLQNFIAARYGLFIHYGLSLLSQH